VDVLIKYLIPLIRKPIRLKYIFVVTFLNKIIGEKKLRTQQLTQTIMKTVLISLFFILIGQTSKAQYFVKSYDFPPLTTRTELGRSIERDFTNGWSITGLFEFNS